MLAVQDHRADDRGGAVWWTLLIGGLAAFAIGPGQHLSPLPRRGTISTPCRIPQDSRSTDSLASTPWSGQHNLHGFKHRSSVGGTG